MSCLDETPGQDGDCTFQSISQDITFTASPRSRALLSQ